MSDPKRPTTIDPMSDYWVFLDWLELKNTKLEAERDRLREVLKAMLKLWADEWDHEGGSIVPEVVVEAREIIKEADHE